MRQIPKLEELIAKGHMKKMTGRGPKNRDIDQALYEWYCVRKAAGERPKSCQVSLRLPIMPIEDMFIHRNINLFFRAFVHDSKLSLKGLFVLPGQ